ncbi:MAG: hypothetical protein WEB00_13450 [Dehalococcoidia bacterium]
MIQRAALLALSAAVFAMAVVSAAAGSPDEPGARGEQAAGVSGFYLVDEVGTGGGVANGAAALTALCEPDDAMLAAGFSGIDPGTSVANHRLIQFSPDGWRVGWRNDGTVDSARLTIVCWRENFGVSLSNFTFAGLANGPASATLGCPEGEDPIGIGGGFGEVNATTRIERSVPYGPDEAWRVSWFSVGTADSVRLQVYCGETSLNIYPKTMLALAGGGDNPTFTLACNDNDVLAAVGFFNVKNGVHLRGARPLDTHTAVISWQNGMSPTHVGLKINCLEVD